MGSIRIVVQRKVLCVEDCFFGWNYEYLEFIRFLTFLAFRRENFREKTRKFYKSVEKSFQKRSKISFLTV